MALDRGLVYRLLNALTERFVREILAIGRDAAGGKEGADASCFAGHHVPVTLLL